MSTEDTNPPETAQDTNPGVARELAALGQIIDLLEALPADARDRSMRYLADRYRHALTHPTRRCVMVDPKPAPEVEAVARFARELAGELREIQGQEIRLDGKVYLVTTEEQILDWIAWHLHQPEEDDFGKVLCPCGWTDGPFGTWQEAADASDKHLADGLAQLAAEGGAR